MVRLSELSVCLGTPVLGENRSVSTIWRRNMSRVRPNRPAARRLGDHGPDVQILTEDRIAGRSRAAIINSRMSRRSPWGLVDREWIGNGHCVRSDPPGINTYFVPERAAKIGPRSVVRITSKAENSLVSFARLGQIISLYVTHGSECVNVSSCSGVSSDKHSGIVRESRKRWTSLSVLARRATASSYR